MAPAQGQDDPATCLSLADFELHAATIVGTPGDDTITGGSGDDGIGGENGADRIRAGHGRAGIEGEDRVRRRPGW